MSGIDHPEMDDLLQWQGFPPFCPPRKVWEPRQIGQISWQVVHVLHLCRRNPWRQRIAQLHLPLVEVIGSLWHFFQYYKRKEADCYQAAYLQRGAAEGRKGSQPLFKNL